MLHKIPKPIFTKLFNLYPPFLGAGVKVKTPEGNFNSFDISMNLKLYNQNYVGTHFGGSLYSMCDPFFMIILMNKLGKNYLVWDKKGEIEYKKPGKGKVRAHFSISDKKVQDIIKQVELNSKHEPQFSVNILNARDEVIAVVTKRLWVALKRT